LLRSTYCTVEQERKIFFRIFDFFVVVVRCTLLNVCESR